MEDITLQMKSLIHHILFRHKIYRLEMHQIQEILYLLQQKPAQQPQEIQELIFRGIRGFNQIYGDNIASALSQPIFNGVSNQTKALMHKVMHQFQFLNSIRAYEMFQPHFQQPALHSLSERGQAPNQILDDQYEKMKLHYMYYGPLSVYSLNQTSQSFYNNVPTNNFVHPPLPLPNQNLVNTQNVQNYQPKSKGRPTLNTSKPSPNQEVFNQKQLLSPKPKYPGRGRPPKLKKTTQEKLNLQSLEQQQQQLRVNVMQFEKQQENKLLQLKQCICEGKKRSGKISTCDCGRMFHLVCSQSQEFCFNCKQQKLDPFTRVVTVIGEFTIQFDQVQEYQGFLNFEPFVSIIQERKPYDIVVSSANANFSDVCWPDDAIFSINQQRIFQIPALLKNHNQSRRADTFLYITQYLKYLYQADQLLNQIKFKLQIKQFPQIQQYKRRNNRDGPFLLSFFLVNRLTVDHLVKQIEEKHENSNNAIPRSPFELANYKDLQLNKVRLSLLDPYSRQLIKCPVKGKKCTHLQCFDLRNFLVVTQALEHRTWRCPYCCRDARDLVIDSYQLNLLNQMKANQVFSSKVVIFANGRLQYCEKESEQLQNSGKSNGE